MIATLPRPTAGARLTNAHMALRSYLAHHSMCLLTLVKDCSTCTRLLTEAIRFEREATHA